MKVENPQPNRLTPKQTEGAGAVEKSQRSMEGDSRLESLKDTDKASLSEEARMLAKAYKTMESTPDVRAEKVETLRNQVNSGNYTVPIEKLAQKLIGRILDQ